MEKDLPRDETPSTENRAATQAHKGTSDVSLVGLCQRCGRGFVTMPLDGIDHWGFRGAECGGVVIRTANQ